MYAARGAKPKLSLSISAAQGTSRPALSLRSPGLASAMPRTPVSPASQASRREYSSMQQPMYAYTNSSSTKSILKKGHHHGSSMGVSSKKLQFQNTPTVYCVTPIENKDEYYGGYAKMSRDERRWGPRNRQVRMRSINTTQHTAQSPGPAPVDLFLPDKTIIHRQEEERFGYKSKQEDKVIQFKRGWR